MYTRACLQISSHPFVLLHSYGITLLAPGLVTICGDQAVGLERPGEYFKAKETENRGLQKSDVSEKAKGLVWG